LHGIAELETNQYGQTNYSYTSPIT
jgi:hypothetical protein